MDEMFITPIQLMHIGESQAPAVAEKTVGQDGVSMFKSIFQSAIEDVITTDQDLSQAEYLLTTGQIDDPATVTTAAAEAQLAVDLLVQLRNRAQEAYTQLMNINI
ncbi:MAG: flagellar hook-basal body complex protein FliE [Lachnospiraceae bacterium]|jgi:flagellar hook-basal body complex protein FliE|nr:flagellar hook-basal body complex protein FliE [Lachnospiraceae bacterium]MCI9099571.1 flagellar hook-basal body complex protein FliE [Lachnospiraceae bacterium]MCI9357171.1 flagellar hook-basal body complex protein FliE [Lachnospiraceae bacterium]